MTERSVTDAAVVGAARKLLETFVGMYQGLDAGEQDSVHRAREKAERRIDRPTAEDPFEVAADVEARRPRRSGRGSRRQPWRDELEGSAYDYESPMPIIGGLESARTHRHDARRTARS